jgi:hypothetical protein
MGFAAGALFLLSSAGNAQTLQAPGKALPMGQAPSKVLPHPQVPGKGLSAAYSDAGTTYAGPPGYYDASGGYGTAGGGYSGGGYAGGTAGYPDGTTSAGPATTRAASAGRGPDWVSGPAWASAASARAADRPRADVRGSRRKLPNIEGFGQLRVKERPTGVATLTIPTANRL